MPLLEEVSSINLLFFKDHLQVNEEVVTIVCLLSNDGNLLIIRSDQINKIFLLLSILLITSFIPACANFLVL